MSCAVGTVEVYSAKSLLPADETVTAGVLSTYSAKGLSPGLETVIGSDVVVECGVIPPPMYVTANSVVFDIADNWGNGFTLAVRSIEFSFEGVVIPLLISDFSASATSERDASSIAANAFNTLLSKVGSEILRSWVGLNPPTQRLIIVFNTVQTFDEIIINNFHNAGFSTDRGVKNVKITASDDAITDTTYNAAIANSTVLNNTVWPEHASSNVIDDQTVWTF